MLTRRHLRIKTMQALYAYVQSDLNDAQLGLRRLEDSIKAINDLYLYELRIFWHFNNFLEERLEIEQAKQFPNRLREAQLQHFLKLPFLAQLVADDSITKAWEQYRIHWGESVDVLRKIFFTYWSEFGETLM
jgi:N utilization substance protein B